jgi:hypothetical protein
VLGDLILVSSYSDGMDILQYSKDSNSSITIFAYKGDKLSRSCISCVWITPQSFAATDKHKHVYLCEISSNSRWIKTVKFISLCEIAFSLFILNGNVHCQTISGSIFDVSKLLE